MKLHLADTSGLNVITRHGAGFVEVNGRRHQRSLIVSAHQLAADWPPDNVAALTAEDFALLVEWQPAVVLLGTGARLTFPAPEITRPLIEARIGVEVMDTAAACRTYNVLVGEARKVAAALLIA